ncbi:MAG: ABC transporter ATP-binding protein [Deltaproteobacteria bacterium]|nr:ABC transporter ATP-binding protein [Deltaproteobacteria bacterium]
MKALTINNVTMKFGGLKALSEVSLSVEQGERKGIIGPNGAGKTTLFNVICGNLQPTIGSVRLFDKDITKMSQHKRVSLGLGRTFQKMNVFQELTVMENIYLALFNKRLGFHAFRTSDTTDAIKGKKLAEQFGLAQRSKLLVKHLSYGDQRVVEILLALALEPRVLLLDEPMAGLSPAERVTITQLIKDLPRDITVLIIEHDLDVLFDIAEQVAVLHYGKVLTDGSNEEIIKNEQVREIYLSKKTRK